MISNESCEAHVLFDKKICSIQIIASVIQGKGHATKCIEKIETISRNKKIKEIWFPTVLSERFGKMLSRLGYDFTNFGPHPMMPDAEDVLGYKKILKKN